MTPWLWYNTILGIVIIVLLSVFLHVYFRYPKNLDCVIMSPGGGGTTYLLKYLHERTNLKTNDLVNYDSLKHPSLQTLSNLSLASPKKALYVFNNPALAIESHFRRGYAASILANLGNPHKLNYMHTLQAKQKYYKDVSKQKMDLFGVENQFDFVISGRLPCEVMCIDFPKLKDIETQERVARFLGLPRHSLSAINIRDSRHSSANHLPENYTIVYHNLYKKMQKMHGVIVHPN